MIRWRISSVAGRGLLLAAGLLLCSGSVAPGLTQPGHSVLDTPHNLRKATTGSMAGLHLRDEGDACLYCHASKSGLKWNRKLATAPSPARSETATMPRATALDSTSLFCLACHDGTQPLDALRTAQGPSSGVTISACSKTCHTPANPGGDLTFAADFFAGGLERHHPIGVIYQPIRSADFAPPGTGEVSGLPLYGPAATQIGCATCHDPHDNSSRPFLRIPRNGGTLCLACHTL